MFQADTRNRQRSGASVSTSYQYQNRTAGAARHSNVELVNAQHQGSGRPRQMRTPMGGFPWQVPNKELDPTVAVTAGTAVYISLNNPLAVTGLMDLVLAVVIPAPPGVWIALKNVPAQVVVSGVTKYNVPQLPTPGTPAGTPLAGDLDGSTVYWARLGTASTC